MEFLAPGILGSLALVASARTGPQDGVLDRYPRVRPVASKSQGVGWLDADHTSVSS
jgi:hypothetical protein